MAAFPRVFLLSPARVGGARTAMLLREGASFDVALRLKAGIATTGEIYSFLSGLYFRGKMAYAGAFHHPPANVPPALVMVPGAGLVPPESTMSRDQVLAIPSVPVEEDEPAFRVPLLRDAKDLDRRAGPECRVILLGSVATRKYTGPLLEVFGERLLFPSEFVGRGDMSRGGLMLRSARSGDELSYVPVLGTPNHGPRPPRLPR